VEKSTKIFFIQNLNIFASFILNDALRYVGILVSCLKNIGSILFIIFGGKITELKNHCYQYFKSIGNKVY